MLNLPRWVPILVGALVLLFGVYRLRLGLRKPDPERKRQGLDAMSNRYHLMFGLVFLATGAFLILSGLRVLHP